VAGGVSGLVARAATAADSALDTVLDRASTYIVEFERQLSGIVSEEQYEQQVTYPKRHPFVSSQHVTLRSDLLLVRPRGASDWFQFRDVYDVNNVPVRDRTDRLTQLFVDPSTTTDQQIRGILAESARYNIGSLARTVNTPVLPLQFLEAKNRRRFKFKLSHDATPAAMTHQAPAPAGHFKVETEVWILEFEEKQRPTMVRTTAMRDLPARGRFWVEPSSGRVLMTELILQDRFVRGTIAVNYQSEPLVGLLVPIEMRERYDHLRDGSTIDGYATYGRFRQFQVFVDEKFAPLKK
jgi:hypothetical protein